MLHIYVDADACPVKDEVYRVAERYRLKVTLVANSPFRVPFDERIRLVVVGGAFDAADDWIVENAGEGDIVVTADIPLASRCLKNGARVIGSTGKPFTDATIGQALAGRELSQHLRESGLISGGPAPLGKQDRSRFLQQLDQDIQAIRRSVGIK
ncbi:YaiI/YqxD family protein [Skermanella mucosa]|uniref:YaiI/YqxD family protein n=1 Tax=Skermanella mucosa TaxID=1789672 RepID=UPI00192C0C2F|nr:YaiI/YqxD family protein [Skermanella mucosa]UEM23940.1 YaiI/YqxD family protein [Skermanella mucosa]